MTDIKIGTKVTAPVSDKDGEVSYVIGVLTDLNSRYATITQTDGTITKVGKSKIEPVADEPQKKVKVDHSLCQKCQSKNGVYDYNSVKGTKDVNTEPYSKMTYRFWCIDCDSYWGAVVSKTISTASRSYIVVKAASGRKSLNNGDATAQMLQGLSLDEIYSKASEILNTKESELRARYLHLNPGQQRMNLGNRIRRQLRLREATVTLAKG